MYRIKITVEHGVLMRAMKTPIQKTNAETITEFIEWVELDYLPNEACFLLDEAVRNIGEWSTTP